jgi:hypothetical protein
MSTFAPLIRRSAPPAAAKQPLTKGRATGTEVHARGCEQQGDILRDYYRQLTASLSTTAWDPFVLQMQAM